MRSSSLVLCTTIFLTSKFTEKYTHNVLYCTGIILHILLPLSYLLYHLVNSTILDCDKAIFQLFLLYRNLTNGRSPIVIYNFWETHWYFLVMYISLQNPAQDSDTDKFGDPQRLRDRMLNLTLKDSSVSSQISQLLKKYRFG